MKSDSVYIAIDLKSFYASVECMKRELDPLTTNLVVADRSRTEKTICLAVSPSLKAYGIPGRARLFEVEERVKQVNEERRKKAPDGRLVGESSDAREILRWRYPMWQRRRGWHCILSTVQRYLTCISNILRRRTSMCTLLMRCSWM